MYDVYDATGTKLATLSSREVERRYLIGSDELDAAIAEHGACRVDGYRLVAHGGPLPAVRDEA